MGYPKKRNGIRSQIKHGKKRIKNNQVSSWHPKTTIKIKRRINPQKETLIKKQITIETTNRTTRTKKDPTITNSRIEKKNQWFINSEIK